MVTFELSPCATYPEVKTAKKHKTTRRVLAALSDPIALRATLARCSTLRLWCPSEGVVSIGRGNWSLARAEVPGAWRGAGQQTLIDLITAR